MSSVAVPDRTTSRDLRAQQTCELFDRAFSTDAAEERRRLVDEVIVLNMDMADGVVARYTGRGVATEDLRQVAYAALTRAAHRFDATHGVEFAGFAVPSMRGEIRKYFRDHAWMVRPTRRIQELQPQIRSAHDDLWRELGRSPRPSEIAEHIGEPVDAVVEALGTDGCFQPSSLDRAVEVGESSPSVGELLGDEDLAQDQAEARIVLQPVIRRLSERDRRILRLRFVQGLTQREMAEDLGVTQMQVSRLLARIYRDLRAGIGDLEPGRGR